VAPWRSRSGRAAGVPAGCSSAAGGPAVAPQVATCQPFRLLPDSGTSRPKIVGVSEGPRTLNFDPSMVNSAPLPVMLVGGPLTLRDQADNGPPGGSRGRSPAW